MSTWRMVRALPMMPYPRRRGSRLPCPARMGLRTQQSDPEARPGGLSDWALEPGTTRSPIPWSTWIPRPCLPMDFPVSGRSTSRREHTVSVLDIYRLTNSCFVRSCILHFPQWRAVWRPPAPDLNVEQATARAEPVNDIETSMLGNLRMRRPCIRAGGHRGDVKY